MQEEELVDFSDEIKEYTVQELNQLTKMTSDVLEHWIKMLEGVPPDKEGLRMAIKISIQQAETDLQLISKEILGRTSAK